MAEDATHGRKSEAREERKKRRPIFGRVAGRVSIAALMIGGCIAGYTYSTGDPPVSWLPKVANDRIRSSFPGMNDGSSTAQRATLYEEDPTDPIGKRFVGSAYWRTRLEPAEPAGGPETVITLEIEVPERELSLTITMRRNNAQGSAISHLIEFRFIRAKKDPLDEISQVLGILMKTAERSGGTELAGRVANVMSGVFLLGLSGADDDKQRNLRLLKEREWLDIPFRYKDGSRHIIAIERGAAGARAIDEALREWGHM
jgi:hypothetical protein